MSLPNSYQHIDSAKSIIDPFFSSLEQYASRNALWVDKHYKTYAELFDLAKKPATWLKQFDAERVLIFSQRTFPAYQGILASLMVGKAYVPLNPKMPATRNAMMVELADSNIVLVDYCELEQLLEVLSQFPSSNFDVLVLNHEKLPLLDSPHNNVRIHCLDQITTDTDLKPTPHKSIHDDACLLFTSGSTGKPKGVMLSHENILSYIRHTVDRYNVTKDDRISQITELTFDFSVQDIFMSWSVGACVYAFPENYFIGLPKYLNENKITFMTTVPSTARLLNNLGKLTKGSLPHLRQNIFGGEPFSDSIAALWQEAAPNTTIDNVCGPTEATIAYLSYTWEKAVAEQKGPRDCIPLGHPFPGQEISILNEQLTPVHSGEIGELYLCGPQVINHYWRNPKLSEERFILLPDANGSMKRWYKTGDMVLWDDEDGIVFKGRADDQIQIRGCRVEKLEIERVLREVAETEFAAILPWPIASDGTVQGVIAFVSGSPIGTNEIYKRCREQLPDYMAPKEIHELQEMPLNFNGKVDYLKLKEQRVAKAEKVIEAQ